MTKPLFEKRHYVKLAEFWHEEGTLHCMEPAVIDAYNYFVKMLSKDDNNFDEAKFRVASGVDQHGRSTR